MIEKLLDRIRPQFEEGGKFRRFHPLFEAADTFLLTTPTTTKKGAHVRDNLDTKRFMIIVVIALLPTVFMGAWNAGYQHYAATDPDAGFAACVVMGLELMLPVILVSYVVGGSWEVLFAIVRRHEVNEGFLVTGLLFPLTLPPTIPLWMVAVGISFGVVIGKEVFGGTGMNIFNPALTARAFVFFSYAGAMSGDRVWADVDYASAPDGISGATPLLAVSSGDPGASAGEILSGFSNQFAQMDYSFWNAAVGFIPGSLGETSTIACLIGALILIVTGVGSWRTMAAVVIGATGMAFVMNGFASAERNPILGMPFYWHFVVGSFAFGTVYMATDPVSSAVTKTGKWVYGILIGVLAILIRAVNPAYPEGMMLAILFMNLFAPLIDYYVVQTNIRKRKAAHAG